MNPLIRFRRLGLSFIFFLKFVCTKQMKHSSHIFFCAPLKKQNDRVLERQEGASMMTEIWFLFLSDQISFIFKLVTNSISLKICLKYARMLRINVMLVIQVILRIWWDEVLNPSANSYCIKESQRFGDSSVLLMLPHLYMSDDIQCCLLNVWPQLNEFVWHYDASQTALAADLIHYRSISAHYYIVSDAENHKTQLKAAQHSEKCHCNLDII